MLTLTPLEKFLRTPMDDRAFTHYELFVAFRSLNFGFKIHNQPVSCFYFIKITCNN